MSRRLSLPAAMTGVLLAATVLLAAYVYGLWQQLDDPVEVEPAATGTAAHPPAPLAGGAPETPALAAFSAVTERPLFTPTRRPFESAPPPMEAAPEIAPPPGPEPIAFSLVGIALSDSGRVALVRRQMDGKVLRVAEGGEVLGWTAASIEGQRAIFRRGDQEEILELNFGAGPIGSFGMEPSPPSEPDPAGAPPEPPAAPDGQGG